MQSNQFIVPIVLISNVLAQIPNQIGGQTPMAGQPQVGFTQPTTAQQWSNAGLAGSNPQATWAGTPNAQQPWTGTANTQASWSRPAAAQPAWPQWTAPQGQNPMVGQPQPGFTQPGQTTAQRWPNTGVPPPAGINPQTFQGAILQGMPTSGASPRPAGNPQTPQGAVPQAGNPQVPSANGAFQPFSQSPQAGSLPQGAAADNSNQEIPIDNVGDVNANGGMTGTVPFNTPTQNPQSTTQDTTQSSAPTSASFKVLPPAIGLWAILLLF